MKFRLLIPVLLSALLIVPARSADEAALALQEAFVKVAQRIKPCVVTVYCERSNKPGPKTPPLPGKKAPDDEEDPFFAPGEPSRRTSLGTGMVISADGYLLTNFHVIKGATFVRVIFSDDGERAGRASARVVGVDAETDLAVLKIERTGLPFVQFADSEKLRIGEWSIAVGSPFDQAQSVTAGIISAMGRHLDGSAKPSLAEYIQTDASINPGNSGGPLVNLDGQVIGINTAILSPSRFNVGIGFALPSNTIKNLLPVLLEGKKIARGFLGIQYVALEKEVAREFGVAGGMQVGALAVASSPAGKAGLKVDDIITAVDGKPVLVSDQFRRLVTGRAPGATVTLTVMRPFEEKPAAKDYVVTLGDWAAGTNSAVELPVISMGMPEGMKLGIVVENGDRLTPMQLEKLNLGKGARGLYVTEVLPGSPADDAQLNPGLRLARVRVAGGQWQDIPTKSVFEKLEKSLADGARVLVQLKDKDDVSVYKVFIVPGAAAVKTVATG